MIDSRIIKSNEKCDGSKTFTEVLQTNKSYLIELPWLNIFPNLSYSKKRDKSTAPSLFRYVVVLADKNLLA